MLTKSEELWLRCTPAESGKESSASDRRDVPSARKRAASKMLHRLGGMKHSLVDCRTDAQTRNPPRCKCRSVGCRSVASAQRRLVCKNQCCPPRARTALSRACGSMPLHTTEGTGAARGHKYKEEGSPSKVSRKKHQTTHTSFSEREAGASAS